MSRLPGAARRTALVLGLATACLAPMVTPAAATPVTTPSTPSTPPTPATPPTPPKPPTIAAVLAPYAGGFDIDNNDFNIATHVVLQFPDLVAAATKPGSATVFLPTDYAFRRLVTSLTGTVVVNEAKLFAKVLTLGHELLGRILRYHVVKGVRLTYGQTLQSNGRVLATLEGATVRVVVVNLPRRTVTLRDKAVHRADAKIVRANITASNGVIHVIDQVMMPIDR